MTRQRTLYPIIFGLSVLFSPPIALSQVALYDVVTLGATGDGTTDDTAAIQAAINGLPIGAVLNFGPPSRSFKLSAPIIFLPSRTYQGQNPRIFMTTGTTGAPPLAKCEYNACSNVTITGLIFDGNGVAGGPQFNVDGGIVVPSSNLNFSYNVIRNTVPSPASDAQGALYFGSGLLNSVVQGNQISNCGRGLTVINPGYSSFLDNSFDQILSGNAMTFPFYAAPAYNYGSGVVISRNHGQHLTRMALEVWPAEALTSTVSGMVITDNEFVMLDNSAADFPYGFSVVAGTAATISHNQVLGGGVVGWGMEIATPRSTITHNMIGGFDVGITLNNTTGSTISGNYITTSNSYGIQLGNAAGSRVGLIIDKNIIVDAKLGGIMTNTADWNGSTISGNRISRTVDSWASDNTRTFTGISIFPPSSPVTVSGNYITQSGTSGSSGFTFTGIAINGGASSNSGSTYANNVITTLMSLSSSSGFSGNSSNTLNGVVFKFNRVKGTNTATSGAGSTSPVAIGNILEGVGSTGATDINH